jgi:putative FmdB family regulatory protein
MPTYEYACKDCGEHLEVVQSFKDDALTVCPNCEGELRKVFSAAGIIFKGSGWHIKDYVVLVRLVLVRLVLERGQVRLTPAAPRA